VLARRQVRQLEPPAREQNSLGPELRLRDPCGDRLAGLVGQLELHRLLAIVLQDDNAVGNGAAVRDIAHAPRDQIASAQLAADGEVEQGEVAQGVGKLQAHPDGPDLPDFQRRLRAGQFALVPGRTGRAGLFGSGVVGHGQSPRWMPRRQDVRRGYRWVLVDPGRTVVATLPFIVACA
jgi:hypothetical protein